MSENAASLEQILPAALQLSSLDKVRLIERLIRVLESDFTEPLEKPYESLYGILADMGPAPSAEEIDETRREMWANFPRGYSLMLSAIADTHAVVWYIFADKRLSNSAVQFVENAATERKQVGVSPITFVEIIYLAERGRIPVHTLENLLAALDHKHSVLVEVPLDRAIAQALANVGRILAATALYFGLPLISRDREIQLSNIATVWLSYRGGKYDTHRHKWLQLRRLERPLLP